jgi:hypothetical protein
MPQAKGMGNQEILKEIKKTIPGAAAMAKEATGST